MPKYLYIFLHTYVFVFVCVAPWGTGASSTGHGLHALGFVLSRIGIEMLNSQCLRFKKKMTMTDVAWRYLSLFTQSRGIADPNCDPCVRFPGLT